MPQFPFFALPFKALGLDPGHALLLCPDQPDDLSIPAWDILARIAASLPQARIVFCVPPKQVGDKASRQALRALFREKLATQALPTDRCLVCSFDDAPYFFAQLLPHAACVVSMKSKDGKKAGKKKNAVNNSKATPLITPDILPLVRPVLRQALSDCSLNTKMPLDNRESADALVEVAINISAQSPYGQALAALLPHAGSCFGEARNSNAAQPPLLLDLTADEDSSVELTVTEDDGTSQSYHTHGLDLRGQVDAYYGRHRSGWAYATDILRHIHNPHAPYFETFLERRFSWGAWMGENLGPILRPWIGIIHVPPHIPPWFGQSNTFGEIARTESWQLSAPYCRGLYTLSHSLRDSLRDIPELQNMPMETLLHPTEFVESHWSPERYAANGQRALVQVGSSYRNLHGLNNVPQGPYQRWVAMGGSSEAFRNSYNQEEDFLRRQGLPLGSHEDIRYLEFLDDATYDAVFTQNVLFAEYYTASATNLVLECIARNTPLLVNPLPAIVEYLGEDYPLYFSNYAMAGEKAADDGIILATYQYLAAMDKSHFTRERFLEDILNSRTYAECMN